MLKMFGIGSENIKELDRGLDDTNILEDEIWQLALDVLENEDEVVLLAPIAGIDLDNIDIAFSQGILTIKWNRQAPEFYLGGFDIKNSECFWWEFVRNIILPENLDFDSIKATMENNLLTIRIKKLQFAAQNIKINRTTV